MIGVHLTFTKGDIYVNIIFLDLWGGRPNPPP